jgi:hypothetical protein
MLLALRLIAPRFEELCCRRAMCGASRSTRFEFSQAVAHQILSHYSVSPFLSHAECRRLEGPPTTKDVGIDTPDTSEERRIILVEHRRSEREWRHKNHVFETYIRGILFFVLHTFWRSAPRPVRSADDARGTPSSALILRSVQLQEPGFGSL